MGNNWFTRFLASVFAANDKNYNNNTKANQNPYGVSHNVNGPRRFSVLSNPTGTKIGLQYDLGRELGRGFFGITYLCTDKETGEELACKSILKKKLTSAVDIEDVRREVQIMKHLPRHPNILSLKDTFEDDIAVHLVMELCEGGELFDRIVAQGHYTERAASAIIKTIVEVIQVCHKHGVMHRDLKPENFLLSNRTETAELKAIDFGLSTFFKPGERFSEIVGSIFYTAPEVLKSNYGPEIDVWSAGVILYVLLCGVPPFWAETEQGIAEAIIRSVVDFESDPWPNVSDNAKDVVRKMLNPDPFKRLTAQQVLDHPWVQNAKRAPNVSLGKTVRRRLKQFSVMIKLKKITLKVIVEHLSVEEVGGIGIKELRDALADEVNTDEDIINAIIKDMDTDKDGRISYEEFAAMMKAGTGWRKASRQYLRDRFYRLSLMLMRDGS